MLPLAFKAPSIFSTEPFTKASEGEEAVRRCPSWPWGLTPGDACEDAPVEAREDAPLAAAELGEVPGVDFEVGACESSVSPPLLEDPFFKSN